MPHSSHSAAPPNATGSDTPPSGGGPVPIDERERFEQVKNALEASEARLRGLYEATPAMLYSIDGDGRIIAVSDYWLDKMGYTRAEVLGRKSLDFYTPESTEYALTVIRPVFFERGWVSDVEHQCIKKNGEIMDVLLSAVLDRDADGKPRGSMTVVQDVTLRRQTERALLEQTRRLSATIEATRVGTWQWNVLADEAHVDERWAMNLGYAHADVEPMSRSAWLALVHPDDLGNAIALLAQHFAGGTDVYEAEVRMRHRDGRWIWIRDRGRVITRTSDGRPLWMYGTQEDVTQRRLQDEALRRSEAFLDRTGRLAGVGGWSLDLATRELTCSPEINRVFGLPSDHRLTVGEALGHVSPESRAALRVAVRASITGGGPFDLEVPHVDAAGRQRWMRTVGSAESIQGRAVRIVGALQDVTQRVAEREELARHNELLRITLQSIGDAVITTDALGNVVWLNPAAERLTGWLSADAAGVAATEVFVLRDERTRAAVVHPVVRCLTEGRVVSLIDRTVLVSRDGSEFGIEDSAAPIRDDRGVLQGVVLVFKDVTEARRLSGEMTYRASHDTLTGLINRFEFELRLSRLLDESRQARTDHALLYLDLDQFKLVNDVCGHAVGDHLLQQVSKLLGDLVRQTDAIARLGGDEFAILLENCSIDRAEQVAQQICDRMDDFRYTHEDRRFRIGTSIGLVPIDARWPTPAAILAAADTCCYAAKEDGRNRVRTWFDSDAGMRARHREMQWTSRIESALDEDGFVLFAQRIAGLCRPLSGVHAEVLLRMRGCEGELIAPGAFLPAAERFGLASRIDRWVLARVIAWMGSVERPGCIENLCVNLSGQSVGDRNFHRWAVDALTAAGPLICSKLSFEVTETAAVTNLADAASFITQVHALDVRVALDDFGAGASSFGYLKTMPVDVLKIDGQFVSNVMDSALDVATVRCFVDVAKIVGVQTVAEMVDSPAVLERLRELGVDCVQGYLIHRPEPIAALLHVAALAIAD